MFLQRAIRNGLRRANAIVRSPSSSLIAFPVFAGGMTAAHYSRPILCFENHTPTACVTSPCNTNCEVISSPGIKMLMSIIRDRNTAQADFVRAADRLMSILAEEGLARLACVVPHKVVTPTGVYDGVKPPSGPSLCAVDIMRSGAILEEAVRKVMPDIHTGKILIQRDEATAEPKLFYSKFPANLPELHVLLCDPMLATGGSALMAIDELKKMGVKEENILFINLLCSPEGLKKFAEKAPKVRILTTGLDEKLNAQKFIVPGLGDMGDRYYGS